MIKRIINKVKRNAWVLRYIIPTIYFNYHYPPFKQAMPLPVFLRKPKLLTLKGSVIIQNGGGRVKPGMIRLGVFGVSIYPSRGIMFQNSGTIVFKGRCTIGNDSYISVGKSGTLILGDCYTATTSLKIACYDIIEFGKDVSCGWECTFMDTDFHRMKYLDGRESPKPYGPIRIGEGCWFGFRSVVQKNTILPKRTTVASNSLVNRAYDIPEASIIAGQPAKLVKTGIYRDMKDDTVVYH